MKKIGMFWGSSSDNTKTAAEFISEYLEMNDVEIESFDIAEIGTDKILEFDDFFDMDLCGTCTACIDDCPTDAIVEPYTLDSSKCISYLTIEHRGKIPEDKKDSLNNWIYGCDICQEVCPWNIKFSKISNKDSFQARDGIKDKKKIKDWQIDKKEFNQIFKKSAVKRTKYEGLMRNIDLVEN